MMGERGEGESERIMVPGIWRNLEECPELGVELGRETQRK